MSVLRRNQYNDYPMFLFDVALQPPDDENPDDATHVAFWVSAFSGMTSEEAYPAQSGILPTFDVAYGGGRPGNAFGQFSSAGDPDAAYASLVSAVTTWAEGYDWNSLVGGTVEPDVTVTVTQYTESQADATPA